MQQVRPLRDGDRSACEDLSFMLARIQSTLNSFLGLRLQQGIMIVCSVFFVGYLFGGNVFAKWSVFDDHEIMWFLGKADRLSLPRLMPKLMQTELSPHSSLPRFRPAYYTLRVLETWAWGKQPGVWYVFHLSILLFFVLVCWFTARSRIGLIASGLLIIYTITFTFWNGIFATLGPGESYATLGLAIFIVGSDRVQLSGDSRLGWLLLLLGTIIAAGSKENFIVLLLPLLVLFIHELRRDRCNWFSGLALGLGLLWCVWIAHTVLGRMQAPGTDVYGSPIGAGARLHMLLDAVRGPGALLLYALAAIFLLTWAIYRRRWPLLARASSTAVLSSGLIIALYVSQVVFYNGDWPTGTRYDFPGMLVLPLALLLALWYLTQMRRLLVPRPAYVTALTVMINLIALVAVASNIPNIAYLRRGAERNVASTTAFTAFVSKLSAVGLEHPDYPMVFESNDPADFEPLFSYPRFLRASSVVNEMYLIWVPARHGVSNFQGSLSKQLAQLSREGMPGEYSPISQLEATGDKCILVLVTGVPRLPCVIQVSGDWRQFH